MAYLHCSLIISSLPVWPTYLQCPHYVERTCCVVLCYHCSIKAHKLQANTKRQSRDSREAASSPARLGPSVTVILLSSPAPLRSHRDRVEVLVLVDLSIGAPGAPCAGLRSPLACSHKQRVGVALRPPLAAFQPSAALSTPQIHHSKVFIGTPEPSSVYLRSQMDSELLMLSEYQWCGVCLLSPAGCLCVTDRQTQTSKGLLV